MKRSFKTEVFLTIPLTFVALGCVCASFLSNQWVSGTATVEDSEFEISYNYGLFWGQKTRETDSTKSYDITVVCQDGICMFSCANDKDYRTNDLENILSSNSSCDNSAASDLHFCEQKANCTNNAQTQSKTDPDDALMHMNTYAASVSFILIGAIFTVVSGIFSFYNVCHTPVELIWGVHGLLLWNGLCSFCYFVVLCTYGAEFNQRLSSGAPISDLARPKVDIYRWTTKENKLGYPYALIGVCFAIHLIHVSMIVYYILKKHKPRQKNVEVGIDVDDKANGTAMIF